VRKGDVVELRAKAQKHDRRPPQPRHDRPAVPQWLESTPSDSGTVRDLPLREQIDVPVREQLIVELYSK
jgi:small subunit ribosomal protein S4